MSSFSIGEHKGDIAALAMGGLAGSAAGNALYAKTPDRLARYTLEDGKRVPHITNRFIHYAQKVSEKDLMNPDHIDPQTDRSYIRRTLMTIRNRASKARNNVVGDERWEFQKIYNLGKKYLTQRDQVPAGDIGLAKRGANAIVYGTKMERSKSALIGGIIGAATSLLIKTGITKYRAHKKEEMERKAKEISF